MKNLFLLFIVLLPTMTNALQTTPYGKIVGVETRGGNMHVQTDFSSGSALGCSVPVGALYMYDFNASGDAAADNFVRSVILSAFLAQKDVSFHLYECNSNDSRPVIGHVRIK